MVWGEKGEAKFLYYQIYFLILPDNSYIPDLYIQ